MGSIERPIVWVGPRESDILESNHIFKKSITIFGSGINNNSSYSEFENIRVNHNDENINIDNWFNQNISNLLQENPLADVMYYNPFLVFLTEDNRIKERAICTNSYELLNLLHNKINTRLLFSNYVSTLNAKTLIGKDCKLEKLKKLFDAEQFIIQSNSSSGGFGTSLLTEENTKKIYNTLNGYDSYLVSPYYKESIPINVHAIISEKKSILLPASVQIMELQDDRLLYKGADFITYKKVEEDIKHKVYKNSKKITSYLASIGYKGVCGIDFLICNNEVLFLEINARYQASTSLLNKSLVDNGFPTIQEMNIYAFLASNNIPEIPHDLQINYSNYSYLFNNNQDQIDSLKKYISDSPNIVSIDYDGFTNTEKVDKNAYLFRFTLNTNITSINPDGGITLHDNVSSSYPKINPTNFKEIKFRLLGQGIKVLKEAANYIQLNGGINEAVFNAIDLKMGVNLHVNAPTNVKLVELSPFTLDRGANGLELYWHSTKICEVEHEKEDVNAKRMTSNGIEFSAISKGTTDRLRIHHQPICYYKVSEQECAFCDLPADGELFKIEDIKEVIDFYLQNIQFRHFLIGGGSSRHDRGWKEILEIASYIRSQSNKDIYLMTTPPQDISLLQLLFESGITQVGFNIEIFDPKVALETMPGKGMIGRDYYYEVLKESVKIWGKKGDVKSIIILGFDKTEFFLQGIERLCELGVEPVISIFRPLPNTTMQDTIPPSYSYISDLYSKIESICLKYDLWPGPSCIPCQNNTLSFPQNYSFI